jgi:hypothetical protein
MPDTAEPMWSETACQGLSNEIFSQLQPLLQSPGELLIAQLLADVSAALTQLKEAHFARAQAEEQAADLARDVLAQHKTATAALARRLEQLEGRP